MAVERIIQQLQRVISSGTKVLLLLSFADVFHESFENVLFSAASCGLLSFIPKMNNPNIKRKYRSNEASTACFSLSSQMKGE